MYVDTAKESRWVIVRETIRSSHKDPDDTIGLSLATVMAAGCLTFGKHV